MHPPVPRVSLFCHFISFPLCSCVCKISELNCFAWNPLFYCGKSHQAFYLVFQLLRRQWNKKPTFLLKHAHQNSHSASIFVNTWLFTFQFPLLWDIFFSLNTASNLAVKPSIRVSLPSTCQQIQTSTKSYKYKARSVRLSNGVINSLFTVESCRNHDLLLQNQNSNMKVSTPLFLQILTILLSTNVCSKSISIPSKCCLHKLASKKATFKNQAGFSPEAEELYFKV